eukprot:scaffold112868_cov31-Tisochrysis_lutea.AAC.5
MPCRILSVGTVHERCRQHPTCVVGGSNPPVPIAISTAQKGDAGVKEGLEASRSCGRVSTAVTSSSGDRCGGKMFCSLRRAANAAANVSAQIAPSTPTLICNSN